MDSIDLSLRSESSLAERTGSDEAHIADLDADMARRIAAGDVDAWDSFFDRYSTWAFRFAYYHLDGNRSDAEDLCSDILMTAAKSIKQFDPLRGTLDVWMHGLSRHRLARFCRSRRIEVPLIPEADHPSSSEENLDLDALFEKALMRDLVNRTLASLPERQATALIGKYVEGFTTEELARISQTTPKAVESLLVRARQAFRSAFNGLLNGGPGGENNE